jgi:AraC-like DNA-binding protein
MIIDPLSHVLSYLKPRKYIAGGFNFGADWSVQFEKHDGIKCFAVLCGRCWLAVEGHPEPVLLEAEDCILLPNGRRFKLAKDLALEPIPIRELPETDAHGGIASLNGGGDTMILAGHFAFSGAHTGFLLGVMPPILKLREKGDKEGLRWALERMRHELTVSRPGCVLVVQNLAHLLLVQTLRLYITHGVGKASGWLFALGDPKLAPAVIAIHSDPGRRWTLPLLAKEAGMSRSKFSLRFKTITGSSPIDYLIRWRMVLACDRLVAGRETISAIAMSLGYESDTAFSTAFKRVIGCPPRKYAERF